MGCAVNSPNKVAYCFPEIMFNGVNKFTFVSNSLEITVKYKLCSRRLLLLKECSGLNTKSVDGICRLATDNKFDLSVSLKI